MTYTMKQGLEEVWNAIANDILQGWETDDCETPTLTGEDVASVVGDYVGTYLPPSLLTEWKAASWEQHDKWLAEAFPKKELYGY